jgi:hypothetical protein
MLNDIETSNVPIHILKTLLENFFSLPPLAKILSVGGVFAVLCGLLFLVIYFSKSVKIGKFSWVSRLWDNSKSEIKEESFQNRISQLEEQIKDHDDLVIRFTQLEAQVIELKKQHERDQLQNRIDTEFCNLRTCSEINSGRFIEKITHMYCTEYNRAIDRLCGDLDYSLRDTHKSLYREGLDNAMKNNIAAIMEKLVFENNFLPTPSEKDDVHEYALKERLFKEEVRNRCSSLLNKSMSAIDDKWKAPFSRDVFKADYMLPLVDKALDVGVEYFYVVICERDKSIFAMYREYGTVFVDFHSFKSHIETEYRRKY